MKDHRESTKFENWKEYAGLSLRYLSDRLVAVETERDDLKSDYQRLVKANADLDALATQDSRRVAELERSIALNSDLQANARIAELEAENERLRIALHDAIDRPKGVVPHSADAFYEPMRCLQAEAQRMGLYDEDEK